MAVKRYDITIDEWRDVNQQDWDLLFARLIDLQSTFASWAGITPVILANKEEYKPYNSKMKLAVYPNPMRPGRVFIGEEADIEPYGVCGFAADKIYPTVPRDAFVIAHDMPENFARELVKRWNSNAN